LFFIKMSDKISCFVKGRRSLERDFDSSKKVLSEEEVERLNAIKIGDYVSKEVYDGPVSRGPRDGLRNYNN